MRTTTGKALQLLIAVLKLFKKQRNVLNHMVRLYELKFSASEITNSATNFFSLMRNLASTIQRHNVNVAYLLEFLAMVCRTNEFCAFKLSIPLPKERNRRCRPTVKCL